IEHMREPDAANPDPTDNHDRDGGDGDLWQTCTWPSGCSRPGDACTTDHLTRLRPWWRTSIENGNPLCDTHHRAKTNNGWKRARVGTDVIDWISPLGTRHRVEVPVYETRPPNPPPKPKSKPLPIDPPFSHKRRPPHHG